MCMLYVHGVHHQSSVKASRQTVVAVNFTKSGSETAVSLFPFSRPLPYGHRITPDDRLSSDVGKVHVEDRASEGIHHHLCVVNVVVDMRRFSHHSPLPDLQITRAK